MPTIVCDNCGETVAANARCSRCGHALKPAETNITRERPPPTSQAIAEEPFIETTPGAPFAAIELPEHYASWEEFRALSPALQLEKINLATVPLPDLRKIEIQPIPDDAPQALESWSKPLGSVRIGSDVLYQRVGGSSLMAIGLLATLCGFGATLVVLNMPFADFCAFACACISMFFGLIVLGVGWRVFFRSPLLNFTAWIFEEGILLRRAGQSTATRWEEIDEFRVDGESGRFSYGLSLLDTEPIIVSMSQSPDIFPLMDYIEIRMASAQLLPRLKAIWDGDHERFGSVTLDREGFRVTKTFVLWSDVHYVIRLGNTLFFECHSRPQGISIRYRDVAFPYLVVALTRVLIAEHTRMKPPAA